MERTSSQVLAVSVILTSHLGSSGPYSKCQMLFPNGWYFLDENKKTNGCDDSCNRVCMIQDAFSQTF